MKKIIGLGICTLILLPIFSVSAAAQQTELQIEIMIDEHMKDKIRYQRNNIVPMVLNTGDEDALNVILKYKIIRGPFKRTYQKTDDTWERLVPGTGFGPCLDKIFGFGKVQIIATASADNAPEVNCSITGFMFGTCYYFLSE